MRDFRLRCIWVSQSLLGLVGLKTACGDAGLLGLYLQSNLETYKILRV